MLKNGHIRDSRRGFNSRSDLPDGLDDQEKERFRDLVQVVKSDSTGFMHTAIIEALREPQFMQRVETALQKRAVIGAASHMAGCSASLKLDPKVLQTILELPPSEVSCLASAAEELRGRKISLTPDLLKEICDQAVVMHVMEAESMKLSEKHDSMMEEESETMDIGHLAQRSL